MVETDVAVGAVRYGPTIAKRRLSRRLAELRNAQGHTANQVCDMLSWGRGKVGRFESNQWKRPEMSDVRDLLRLYNAPPEVQAELEDLASRARARTWWREYSDVFGDGEYPGYEEDATRIRVYMPLILPALLQTPAYMEAHLTEGTRSPEWSRRAREARQRRQEIFDRTDGTAPEFVAVITEASLSYRWGTAADRREQLAHLIHMAGRPGVEIRLLRFADGPHPGMSSLISIFDFPGDEPSVVFLENDVGVQEVIDSAQVEQYAKVFERIYMAAQPAPATLAYLEQLMAKE